MSVIEFSATKSDITVQLVGALPLDPVGDFRSPYQLGFPPKPLPCRRQCFTELTVKISWCYSLRRFDTVPQSDIHTYPDRQTIASAIACCYADAL